MKIGIRIPPCAPAGEVAGCVQRAESLGYAMAWFPDSQLLWRDAFLAMALATQRTSTIGLGTGVTNLVTRHPTVIASLIRTLQELASGRISLGLGAGSSSVRPLGLPQATNADLASGVEQIRALLAGDAADFAGHRVTMRNPSAPCPIFLAVTGPKRLQLAGRIADGVILHRGTTPEQVAPALALVQRGAQAVGRTLERFEMIVTGITLVSDDLERDARLVKPICRTMFQDGGADTLRAAGIELEEAPVTARGSKGGSSVEDFKHGTDWGRSVAEADRVVTDDAAVRFAREFCFVGDDRQIAGQFDRLAAVGVTQVLLQDLSSHQLPWRILDAVQPGASR